MHNSRGLIPENSTVSESVSEMNYITSVRFKHMFIFTVVFSSADGQGCMIFAQNEDLVG